MEITRLERIKDTDRWRLEAGDVSLTVDTGAVAELGLYRGMELGPEELEAVRGAAAKTSAKERALRLLGARQLSRAELIKKLTEKGETPEAAEYAAGLMERIGAVNDAEYAGAIVRHYSRKGYGLRRIKEEFYRRGVPREYWDEALEELPEDGGETAYSLLIRRLGAEYDDADKRRAANYLARRGYSWGEVREALGRLEEDEHS